MPGEVNVTLKWTRGILPFITTGALTSATVGVPYTFALDFLGTPTPTIALQAGTLPAGLSVSSAGVISGTPTSAATTSGLVFRATNSAGFADSPSLSLTVAAAGAGPVLVTAPSVLAWSGTTTSAGSILVPQPATWTNEKVAAQYPIQRTYRWLKNGTVIPNVFGGTYTVLGSDVGSTISVQETAYFVPESNDGITYYAPVNTSAATSASVTIASGTQDASLVYSNNITYLGSFALKLGQFDGSLGYGSISHLLPSSVSANGSTTLVASGYNDNVNAYPAKWAEVSIPATLANAFNGETLPFVTSLRPSGGNYSSFYDIYEGTLQNSGIGSSGWYAAPTQGINLSGTSDQIMASSVGYPPGQPYSLWRKRSANVSTTGSLSGAFTIWDTSTANTASRWSAGYIFPIPSAYQASLGNKEYLAGIFGMSIITSQSDGPSGIAFSAADVNTALTKYTTGTAQGGASNNIILKASDTAASGDYVNNLIYAPSAATDGFVRQITAYNATTKTATISGTWNVLPTSSTAYSIYPNVNGKQLFGYQENQLDALGTNTPSTDKSFYPVHHWDGACIGGCFPNGTRSILMFQSNGDGFWTYGIAGQTDVAGTNARIYRPGTYAQNAPGAFPYYVKCVAYDVNDLISVQNGSKAYNAVKPYAVFNVRIPYLSDDMQVPVGGTTVYDSATKKLYINIGESVHVYSVTNAS